MTSKPVAEHRERELKFDVPDDWALPDPTALAPSGGSATSEVLQLESSYYDTADRALLSAGLTLRRRTGDTDTGWHLKVPDGDARLELRVPLGGRGVPAQLRTVTHGVRRGATLKPVAIVRVARTANRLVDAAGQLLAEIVVDDVHSTELGEFAVGRHWREVEVELAGGDERLLARCARWLGKRGATRSASPSKLRRALDAESEQPNAQGLAGLVQTYLDEQYTAMVRGDLDVRRGAESIHASRTAIRRYRSVLRVFEPVLAAERAQWLQAELAWWASALGEVRDRQVLRTHLHDALAQLPPELVLGPVAARIDETLAAEETQARAALDALMRTRRYFALVAELAAWHEAAPVTASTAAAAVARYVRLAERKARRRLVRADAEGGQLGDEQLHSARKAAKRARYVAELAEPELGKQARTTERAMKHLQTELGDHQDHVMAALFLRRVGAAAGTTPGENGFTFGLLYAREVEAAAR